MKESVNVFGKEISIEIKDMGEEIAGEYDASKASISISKTLSGRDLKQTILHEELHAVFDRLAFRQAIELGLEEVMVDSIATFIVDNYIIKPK